MFNLPAIIPTPKDDAAAKPRPPDATPIKLPTFNTSPSSDGLLHDLTVRDLRDLYVRKPPTKWNPQNLEALGLEFADEFQLDDLLPGNYVPPRTWLKEPDPGQACAQESRKDREDGRNDARALDHATFYKLYREICCERADAMEALSRVKPIPGSGKVQLIHYRKFWLDFDNVGSYWDTSKDNFQPPETGTEKSNGTDVSSAQPSSDSVDTQYYGLRRSTGKEMPNTHREELVRNFLQPIVRHMRCHLQASRGPVAPLPDPRRFVQMFDARIQFPVSSIVYQQQEDKNNPRLSLNKGPLLAVSARPLVEFSQVSSNNTKPVDLEPVTADNSGETTSDSCRMMDYMDALREVGILLMLAQFRARQAVSEDEPDSSKDQWWAKKRRFGGHELKGAEVRSRDSIDKTIKVSEEESTKGIEQEGQEEKPSPARGQAKLTISEILAKTLSSENAVQPSIYKSREVRRDKRTREENPGWQRRRDMSWAAPKPLWDPKTVFSPVGQGPEQEHDCVYLISSLFHHISILCLRVHPQMIDLLNQRQAPKINLNTRIFDLIEPDKYGLLVNRSRWYDLLKSADRVEAFRAVWGVMAYMTRDAQNTVEADAEFSKAFAQRGVLARTFGRGQEKQETAS